jgi:hypothetical protein
MPCPLDVTTHRPLCLPGGYKTGNELSGVDQLPREPNGWAWVHCTVVEFVVLDCDAATAITAASAITVPTAIVPAPATLTPAVITSVELELVEPVPLPGVHSALLSADGMNATAKRSSMMIAVYFAKFPLLMTNPLNKSLVQSPVASNSSLNDIRSLAYSLLSDPGGNNTGWISGY